jgi:hypothetical protein
LIDKKIGPLKMGKKAEPRGAGGNIRRKRVPPLCVSKVGLGGTARDSHSKGSALGTPRGAERIPGIQILLLAVGIGSAGAGFFMPGFRLFDGFTLAPLRLFLDKLPSGN